MYNKCQQTQNEKCVSAYKQVQYEKMYNILACTTKDNTAPKTYDDGIQIASNDMSILNLVNINKSVEQKMNKILMDQLLKLYKTFIFH